MNNNQYRPLTGDHIWFLDKDHSLTGAAAQEFLEQQMSFIQHAFNDAYSLKKRICSGTVITHFCILFHVPFKLRADAVIHR